MGSACARYDRGPPLENCRQPSSTRLDRLRAAGIGNCGPVHYLPNRRTHLATEGKDFAVTISVERNCCRPRGWPGGALIDRDPFFVEQRLYGIDGRRRNQNASQRVG